MPILTRLPDSLRSLEGSGRELIGRFRELRQTRVQCSGRSAMLSPPPGDTQNEESRARRQLSGAARRIETGDGQNY